MHIRSRGREPQKALFTSCCLSNLSETFPNLHVWEVTKKIMPGRFPILSLRMNTQLVAKDPLSPFIQKYGHYGGHGAASAHDGFEAQGDVQRLWWAQAEQVGSLHGRARHHHRSIFFWKETFLAVCVDITLRIKCYWAGWPMHNVLWTSRGEKLGMERKSRKREKGENPAEFNLNSVSITQNDTNQPLLDHAKATLLPAIPSLLSKPLFSSA